jgi:hypothetical protein
MRFSHGSGSLMGSDRHPSDSLTGGCSMPGDFHYNHAYRFAARLDSRCPVARWGAQVQLSARLHHYLPMHVLRWANRVPPSLVARLVLIGTGALNAIVAAMYELMNPDGIAYLDMADRYSRGAWAEAINPVWSPLYAVSLVPAVSGATSGSRHREFTTVHVLNFCIYLFALFAFEFYWKQAMRNARVNNTHPNWTQVLGYALFASSALIFIGVWSVTPDMLMAGLLYVAAALVVKIRLEHVSPWTYAALGAVLGFAFLAKSVMFPLGLVILGLGVLVAHPTKDRVRALLAVTVFGLVTTPFIWLISKAEDRLTFGEAGRLTYARYVSGVPYPHWQGDDSQTGQMLLHPSRQIQDNPRVFEFAEPIHATYPITYDPSYWYEGLATRFTLANQGRVIWPNLLAYLNLLFPAHAALVALVCLCDWRTRGQPIRTMHVLRTSSLALVAIVALGMYAFVLVEARYVAAFLPLVWGDVLGIIRPPGSIRRRRAALVSTAIAVACLIAPVLKSNIDSVRKITLLLTTEPDYRTALVRTWPSEVADELHRLGVEAGSRVAVIGFAATAYWARLARVQIVAEMFGWEAGPFWASESTRTQTMNAFRRAGAIAIVAEDTLAYGPFTGWYRVRNSDHYIYLLRQ